MDINLILGIAGAVLGIAGIALSVYFYLKSKEAKQPLCYYKTYRNIRKLTDDSDLAITFKGIEVKRVSTSYVFFWNKGRKPIFKKDVLPGSPIQISFPDIEVNGQKEEIQILDYKVLKTNKNDIDFSVSKPGMNMLLQLDFDYLAQNNGAVIEIKHTGNEDSNLFITGTIPEINGELKANKIKQDKLKRITVSWSPKVLASALVVAGIILSICMFFAAFMAPLLQNIDTMQKIIHLVGVATFEIITGITIGLLIPVASYFFGREGFFNSILPFPKSLDIDVDTKEI